MYSLLLRHVEFQIKVENVPHFTLIKSRNYDYVKSLQSHTMSHWSSGLPVRGYLSETGISPVSVVLLQLLTCILYIVTEMVVKALGTFGNKCCLTLAFCLITHNSYFYLPSCRPPLRYEI
jgi:hypothetical protein